MTLHRRRDWLVLFLPLILSPFFLSGLAWLAKPRIDEAIHTAMDLPPGQVVACGLEDCAIVATRLSALTARIAALEAHGPLAAGDPGPCESRPTRMEVDPGSPGEWVELRIFGVCRIRAGCGAPVLNPSLVNGGGRFHSMESAFNGLSMPEGHCRDFIFPVRIPEDAHPGRGEVLLGITFPFASPPTESMIFGPARLTIQEASNAAD
ncbi:MAG: hypothetical protein AAGE03_04390 [Pseudomonadota bacterium]